MTEEIFKYVEPIYRFCAKRLSSRIDAEDLAQDILVAVLEGMNKQKIDNLEGYVWRVAHNRYAKSIENKNKNVIMLCGDDYLNSFEYKPSDIKDIDRDQYNLLFKALHSLSAAYRDIMVDFYLKELDIREISSKYGISTETVKWRLHSSREKMKVRLNKVNRTYEKIKMNVMCNGSFDPNKYLCNQLYKSIALVCYEKPLGIEDISIATGVPTLYLEEALDFMVYGDAIEKTGSKYQTNFIIRNSADAKRAALILKPFVKEITDSIWSFLNNNYESIMEVGFYGSAFPIQKLAYILVPLTVRKHVEKGIVRNNEIFSNHYSQPLRKDGGNGWFIVAEGKESLDETYSGCNQYNYISSDYKKDGSFVYYWLGDTFNRKLSNNLNNSFNFFKLADCITGEIGRCEEEELAKAISLNLVVKNSDKYFSSVPIFTKLQYDALTCFIERNIDLSSLFDEYIKALYNDYKAYTPKRLHDQIIGNVESDSFNITAFVIKELQAKKIIMPPKNDQIFTSNVFYIKE